MQSGEQESHAPISHVSCDFALPLFAQQTSTSEQPTTNPYAAPQMNIPAAPKAGHPLDPNDVATLTGKNNQNQRQQNYATPQMYYSAPVGGSMFTQSSAGNAFADGSNVGYDMMVTNGYGYAPYGAYGYGLGGSQFANVTTATRLRFGFGAIGRPGASPVRGRCCKRLREDCHAWMQRI